MQLAQSHARHHAARRAAYAAFALLLLSAAIAQIELRDTGWWPLLAFAMAPDVALLAGFGRDLEKGRLHPRAVRLYNALHSLWGPALLSLAALALPAAALVCATVWAFHIAFDRALGYGMRTRDGYQRS
jgi:hypothetical protein